jgi:RimJ/RimL family protein N-acetyltransferase
MPKRILQTQRLYLDEIKECHFHDLFKLLSNQKVQRFFPKVLSRKETLDFYNKIQHNYKSFGYCYWAVTRKQDDEFLGICGLLHQRVDKLEEVEIGYRLLDCFWGQSYGPEAAMGCMEYAQQHLHCTSVISLILAENKPSIRVAEKNGLEFEKISIVHGLPHHVYRKHF